MAHMTATNPISDLMYDWLTVLQSKAEGVNAYEKYIRDRTSIWDGTIADIGPKICQFLS